jgi:endoglucanase
MKHSAPIDFAQYGESDFHVRAIPNKLIFQNGEPKLKSNLMVKKSLTVLISTSFLAGGSVWAGPQLTNQLGGTIPQAATNYSKSQPFICNVNDANHDITEVVIAPGETKALKYPAVNSAAVRLGGCGLDDSYIGWIYNLTAPPATIDPDPATGFKITGLTYSNGVLSGSTSYLPIQSTATADILAITPTIPASSRRLDFVGVNLSGAEFGDVIAPYSIPDLSTTTASTARSDLVTMKQYVPQGLNTVRLPISWSYLELLSSSSTLANPQWIFNDAYWTNFIRPALVTLTTAHINTMVDLHTYLHYPLYGAEFSGCGDTGYCPDGTLDTNPEHYKTVWRDIWTKIKNDPAINQNYIMFDLVNEPATDPAKPSEQLTPQQAYNVQMAVINELQNSTNNFQGKILVEGAYWSGLHSWNQDAGGNGALTNAAVFTKANMLNSGVNFGPNGDRVVINVHQYFDSNFSGNGTTCVSSLNSLNLQPFASWLTAQGLKAMVTEFGTPYNNAASCQTVLSNFVKYMVDNRATQGTGGFIGATLWGAGRGWSPTYNLYVTPTSYQFTTLMQGAITP